MDKYSLLIVSCLVLSISAWSLPYYPGAGAPLRITRYAPPPPPPVYKIPVEHEPKQRERPKRGHHDYDDDRSSSSSGITGPVHTFVKTDKNANYKWGVRHHVGDKFSS